MVKNSGVTCKVCGKGEIISRTECHHCNVCGVRYEFVPAKNLEPPKTSGRTLQVTPYLWIVKKSTSVFARN